MVIAAHLGIKADLAEVAEVALAETLTDKITSLDLA
jgi:hypothetical protein